jgi:Na+-translocating ferredoxin:NAD+ oxidoreductase subunit G
MKNILRDTIKITLITLISGILLGFVFQITKEPIAKAQEDAKQNAYKKVFSQATSFEEDSAFNKEDAAKYLEEQKMSESQIDLLVKALDSDKNVIGYVVNVTNHKAYSGDISYTIGVKTDGTLNDFEILSISETAGLGMKAKEDKFKSQFHNVKVDQFTVTKQKAGSESEIEAISGATITSKAVTNGVNAGISYINSILAKGGK